MIVKYIKEQESLAEFVELLQCADTVFIDTEFIKRDTFYPILALLQINLAHNDDSYLDTENALQDCYLIDVLSLNLGILWEALFVRKLLVMHACSEDVDLLVQEATKHGISSHLPQIFDTQIGLSFLDYGLQISYQKALAELLNIEIDKGESCSNWLKRPLTEKQLEYAVNDVRYLPQLYATITEKLQHNSTEINLYDCVLADSAALAQDVLSSYTDEEVYQEWADYRYDRTQLAQLQKICEWREVRARNANIPRTFLIKKSSLKDLIQRQPINKKELSYVKDLQESTVRKYGNSILDCLHADFDITDLPQKRLRPFRETMEMDLSEQLQELIDDRAIKLNIPVDVLMRKRWRNKLYNHVAIFGQVIENDSHEAVTNVFQQQKNELPSYIYTWRYELVTLPILLLINQYYTEIHQQIIPLEQQ